MITVDMPTCELVARVLRESNHPEAPAAAKKMLRAILETQARDLDFNEAPALCRLQA